MEEEEETSYLDYDTFLDPAFSPTNFANTLVLATNNASDTPLDLTTPLSRVLFDVQEVDTHIDKLTNTSALPLLNYTQENVQAGERILQGLESQVSALASSYERLEREIITRHNAAEEARVASSRVWETVKLGRVVSRCLTLGRQLEAQMSDIKGASTGSAAKGEDFGAMVRGAYTLLTLRQIFNSIHPGGEGEGLDDINVIKSMRTQLVDSAERAIVSRAEQIVGQFSMSSLTTQLNDAAAASTAAAGSSSTVTYSQAEEAKSRASAALITLYLLSPAPDKNSKEQYDPSLLVAALQEYLRRAITSSLAGLSTALATLPKLDRTLLEVSARCQNIVALEMLLESLEPPQHPMLEADPDGTDGSMANGRNSRQPPNLLQPLLASLDTSSLPSYFWRSMASQLTSRVQRILKEGGVSARTLRSNKERIRDAIRQCVNRGSTLSAGTVVGGNKTADTTVGNWEREAAVMVGSVVNVLGR